jgi:hypothetical protein
VHESAPIAGHRLASPPGLAAWIDFGAGGSLYVPRRSSSGPIMHLPHPRMREKENERWQTLLQSSCLAR